MSAPQQALVGGGGIVKYTTTMTRGTDGGKAPTTGFQSSPSVYGSLGSATFFKGTTCTEYATGPNVTNLNIVLVGLFPQSYINKTVNSLGTFLGSAATWSQGGGTTLWQWAVGSQFATSGSETIEIHG